MNSTEQTETQQVLAVPKSEWYKVTLACGHIVYTKVRFTYEKPNRQEHKIRCPACDRQKKQINTPPTAWQDVTKYEAANNDEVSNVSSGLAFVLPGRILRLDSGGTTNGNPYPYTSKDREY